jgi:hypothetical protein
MKKNITMSLAAFALLVTGLFVVACSSNTGQQATQPGAHQMGSAPMSNVKHPGKVPGQ